MFYKQICQVRPEYEVEAAESRLWGDSLPAGEQKANDPKLSDRGVRRGTCMVGGKTAAEASAVTHGAVRCSVWLGVSGCLLTCECGKDAMPCAE
jgi:hypothetical protein